MNFPKQLLAIRPSPKVEASANPQTTDSPRKSRPIVEYSSRLNAARTDGKMQGTRIPTTGRGIAQSTRVRPGIVHVREVFAYVTRALGIHEYETQREKSGARAEPRFFPVIKNYAVEALVCQSTRLR